MARRAMADGGAANFGCNRWLSGVGGLGNSRNGVAAIEVPLLDMLPSHRLALPPYEFDKPRLSGPDYLLIERRD
jgi:hypothetical protein